MHFGSGKLLIEIFEKTVENQLIRADLHHRLPGRGLAAGASF